MLGAGAGAWVGESIRPLKTAKFVNGPGAKPCAAGPAATQSHKLGIFPKGGSIVLVVVDEAANTLNTLCVFRSTKFGPGFVFGSVDVGGNVNSGFVIPDADTDQAKSLVNAAKRIASLANS